MSTEDDDANETGSGDESAASDESTAADESPAADELLLNERETDEGLLVSVCDPDDLGETYEDGNVSLTVEEDFYDGETADPDEVVESLANCTTANLVGTECVGLAIEHGFVDEDNVLEFDGTRHAQLLWM